MHRPVEEWVLWTSLTSKGHCGDTNNPVNCGGCVWGASELRQGVQFRLYLKEGRISGTVILFFCIEGYTLGFNFL